MRRTAELLGAAIAGAALATVIGAAASTAKGPPAGTTTCEWQLSTIKARLESIERNGYAIDTKLDDITTAVQGIQHRMPLR